MGETLKLRGWNIKGILTTQKLLDQEYHCNAGVTRGETFQRRKLALWVELGELVNEWKELFKYWSNKKMDRDKALMEYVDGIHFLLSLANDLNIPPYHNAVVKLDDPIDHIFTLGVAISDISGVESFNHAFALFRGLGDHFGFSDKEVERAYHKKNIENMKRTDHNIRAINLLQEDL